MNIFLVCSFLNFKPYLTVKKRRCGCYFSMKQWLVEQGLYLWVTMGNTKKYYNKWSKLFLNGILIFFKKSNFENQNRRLKIGIWIKSTVRSLLLPLFQFLKFIYYIYMYMYLFCRDMRSLYFLVDILIKILYNCFKLMSY